MFAGDVNANYVVDAAAYEAAITTKLGDVDVAGHGEVESVVARGHHEDVAKTVADGHAASNHLVEAGGVDLLDKTPVDVVGEIVGAGHGVAEIDAAKREGNVVEVAGTEQALGKTHEYGAQATVEDGIDAERVDVDSDIAEIGVADGRVELEGRVGRIGLVANGVGCGEGDAAEQSHIVSFAGTETEGQSNGHGDN